MSNRRPVVSVLLPTYNRARFLPDAFSAIASQTLTSWELVIVDDGSTDETAKIVHQAIQRLDRPVIHVSQANAGAYAARNTALDHASAPYVAFYDSDDVWLPHHLANGVAALNRSPDVAWIYGSSRILDVASGLVLHTDTFKLNGRPRPFRKLRVRQVGTLRVIEDPRAVAWALRYGLYCGLQNSVIRRSVFETDRFDTRFRNEAEDQLFLIRALKRGHRVGYLDDCHVEYHVHDANSSASAVGRSADQELSVYRPVVRGFETLRGEFDWTPLERKELDRRIGREYFWHIGYALLWKSGRRAEAIDAYRTGLESWPWSLACWKTYALARLRAGRG